MKLKLLLIAIEYKSEQRESRFVVALSDILCLYILVRSVELQYTLINMDRMQYHIFTPAEIYSILYGI